MLNTLKFEHEIFDFQGIFVCRCLPVGDSRRYDEEFWRELFGGSGGNHKRSKEQNLKELGF